MIIISKDKNSFMQLFLLYSMLVFYIIIMLSALIFKYISPSQLFMRERYFSNSVNLVPFFTIRSYINSYGRIPTSIIFNNIIGNILIFIPLGVYLQLLKKNKNIFLSFFYILFITTFVELSQFVFGIGAADVDDIILNFIGGVIGVILYRFFKLFLKTDKKMRSFVAILSSIIGIPILIIEILILFFN